MEDRTQKLIVCVGEEGPQYEARDFKKITTNIVENFISTNNQIYNENFIKLICRAIQGIPLKQHIYAGLVISIRKVNPDLVARIIQNVISSLQKAISGLKLYPSINLILFLAELMNVSFINSLNFLNMLEDISIYMQNSKIAYHRQFFVHLITRTLPYYAYSLNQKVAHDFKKFIERVRKYCGSGKNLLFTWIVDQFHKRTLIDFSLMNRLEMDFNQMEQMEVNFKIGLNIEEDKLFQPVQYQFPSSETQRQNNKLYQQFLRTQSSIHQYNIEQIIQTFASNSTFLNEKLQVYIKYHENAYINKFLVQMLIAKSLKSKNSVVEPMIILKLIQASAQGMWEQKSNKGSVISFQDITENTLLLYFHKESENFDLNLLYRFTEIISLIITNLPENTLWDWEKYVIDYNNNEQQQYKKRKVILKLLLQKIVLLNDRYQSHSCLSIYHPPQVIKNEVKYKNIRDMEMYERFIEHIKNKADSQQIMSKFQQPLTDYEIFLDALLQKCSLSHTHLQILMSRYQGIFEKNKEEYDWTLINKIRTFWRKSLYHRLIYLRWVIEHKYCDFQSYVKYIGKLNTDNQQEQLWIKIQLNQLNKRFKTLLQSK